jgi:glucosyl-3-phosphoglycerate phosphatase
VEGLPRPAAGRSRRGRRGVRLLSEGRRLVLWRHGRTVWNAEGRFQGQLDIPLDETGRAQAEAAARRLAALAPGVIVASDLGRAVETATPLAKLTGLDVATDPDLRETFLGEWQGMTLPEVAGRFPDEVEAWHHGRLVRRGGGELETEVAERVERAVERALETVQPDGTLVVVSHGSALRVGIGRLVGLPAEHWKSLGALANCSWSVLGDAVAGWRLAEHNAGSLPEPVLGDDE